MPMFIEIVVVFFRTIIIEILMEIVFYGIFKLISTIIKRLYRGLKNIFNFRKK